MSELAWVFNIGLFLAGILFIPFMIGLGLYIDNIISKIAAVGGVYSAVSITLVGVFPMNYLLEHSITAISFFLSGMVMTLLWAIAILVQKEVRNIILLTVKDPAPTSDSNLEHRNPQVLLALTRNSR